MAQINLENLTIYVIASLTNYLKGVGFGIPVIFDQQMLEKNPNTPDNLEVLFDGPNFNRKGSSNETYGTVGVRILVKTTMKPTDVYYHTRIKGRVVEALDKNIQLKRIGGSGSDFDKMIIGLLRPLKTDIMTVTPISIVEPDGSIVERVFSVDLC